MDDNLTTVPAAADTAAGARRSGQHPPLVLRGSLDLGLPLSKYHYLFRLLAERDLKERYAGSWMGLSWSVLQPLALFSIYLLVFSVFLKVRPDDIYANVPFPLWLLAGMTPWLFVSEILSRAPTQVTEHYRMVTKNAFPNEMLPTVTALSALSNHLLSLLLLWIPLLYCGFQPAGSMLWLPAWTVVLLVFVVGLAWLLSAVGVYFRDLTHLSSLMAMVWSFSTPVFYPEQRVPASYHWILACNPLYVMVRGYRAALLGHPGSAEDLAMGAAWALAAAAVGALAFRRLKRGFADLL